MPDNEPTQEELREFWICFCDGIVRITPSAHHPGSEYWTWIDSEGKELDSIELDLNFLFKYAVPKLGKLTRIVLLEWIEAMITRKEDPTISLYRAIQDSRLLGKQEARNVR